MVLHRVLRKMQPRSDFLVGKSPADQFYRLVFAAAEFRAVAGLQILPDRELLGGAAKQSR